MKKSTEKKLEKIYDFIYKQVEESGVSNLDWDINISIDRNYANVSFKISKREMTMGEIWERSDLIREYIVKTKLLQDLRYTDVIKFHRPNGIGPDSGFPDRLEIEVHTKTSYSRDWDGNFTKR